MKTYRGSCHCGRVRFEIRTELTRVSECNCSICRRKGALWHPAAESDLQIVAGEADLALYQFNTSIAKHYFCKHCGIYTHHQPRTKPDWIGVNMGCIEGVSPFDFETVPVNDGIHHPSDGKSSGIIGYLKFSRSP